jgi:hypothetical protein
VLRAACRVDRWQANGCTRDELAELADVAMQEPEETDDATHRRSILMCDGTRFRATVAGEPREGERQDEHS